MSVPVLRRGCGLLGALCGKVVRMEWRVVGVVYLVTYSRMAFSSALRTVGSGADSSESEGDVAAASCMSLARVYAAA